MNKERLEKLATHLESGKLGHEKFDFNRWNADKDGDSPARECGYAGCAIGECPIVFAEDWEFFYKPRLKASFSGPLSCARRFFSISDEAANHLFLPDSQDCPRYGGHILGIAATPAQVAANIRAFIAIEEAAQ